MTRLPPGPPPAHNPTSDEPALDAWLAIARLADQGTRAISRALQAYDVSSGQFLLLRAANEREGITQQAITDYLGQSKAAVSQMLDRLERAGLVRRAPEGRTYRIVLTYTGRKLLRELAPVVDRVLADLFAPLAPEDRTRLFALLKGIN